MLKRTVYFGSACYLNKEQNQLRIRRPDDDLSLGTVPLEDIGAVVLDHPRITLTVPLLQALGQQNAAVIICDQKHLPLVTLQPLYKHTLHTKILRLQLGASVPLNKQLWTQTVRAKIENQARLLRKYGQNAAPLHRWIKEVKSGDTENTEAKAAVYYWKKYMREIMECAVYREREGEPPNHLLNYAYAVLRALVCQTLVAAGLHPARGIFHKNQYNPHCLADDIMEPYRPYADDLTIKIVRRYGKIEELTREIKAELLSIATVNVNIDGHLSPLINGLRKTVSSLSGCYQGERRTLNYPKF